jgi:hypothetical protein
MACTLAFMFNPMKRVFMQSLSVPAIHRAARSTVSQTSNFQCTQIEKRLIVIGILLAVLALLGSLWGGDIAQWFGLQLNAHGHTHVHAHGHPFIDARVLWGVPNALDVLSNLAFVPLGAAGLWVLHRAPSVHSAARQSATVFFIGLLLTCISSSIYHWAPSVWGLAVDRAGMAVAFAGVLGLAAAERISLRAAPWVWSVVLLAGLIAIMLNYAMGVMAPWIAVQFGGMAVVLWAAAQPRRAGAVGVRWGVVIAIYVVAKCLELGDEAVFHATGGLVSGHSLKHVVASLAALPVIAALRHNR